MQMRILRKLTTDDISASPKEQNFGALPGQPGKFILFAISRYVGGATTCMGERQLLAHRCRSGIPVIGFPADLLRRLQLRWSRNGSGCVTEAPKPREWLSEMAENRPRSRCGGQEWRVVSLKRHPEGSINRGKQRYQFTRHRKHRVVTRRQFDVGPTLHLPRQLMRRGNVGISRGA